jgi:ABC-type branched-subunit amino acid transport system substrate-binding protein
LAVALLLPVACGSRLPDDVLARIDAGTLGGNGNAATAGGTRAAGTTGAGGTSTAGGTGTAGPTGGGTDGGAVGGTNAGGAAADCHGGATDTGVTADEIKVAAMVTASGPLPGATEGQYRGAAAYLAKVNAEGGVCGRKITIVEGDDGLDPQRARSEFLRLEPQVFAFVGNLAVADSGYIDLLESTKVPYVGVSVDPKGRPIESVVPHADPAPGTHVANTGPYVHLLQQHPTATKAAFLYADVGGVRANIGGSLEPMKRAGYQIVYGPSGAGATSPDYTPEVINMQASGAQVVYLFAFEVNMHIRMARSMRQQNFEPELKMSNIGYNSQLIKLLGDVANGWINPIPHAPMLDAAEPAVNPPLAEFLKWNTELFPDSSVDLFPVNGWAAAAQFVRGLQALGANVTRAGLVDAINALPEDDGGGMIGTVYPAKRQGSPCFVIEKVENQQWVREYPASGYECNLGESFEWHD